MANKPNDMDMYDKAALWEEEESIATRVTELRKYKKWSQSELAKRIGESRSQISRLESGETKNVSSDLVVKLAKAFGVITDYLLGMTVFPKPAYTDIEKLGLSEEAVKKLLSGSIDRDVLNRLLEHESFGALTKQVRYYFDDTFTEGYLARNEVLDFGIDALKQYRQENPKTRSETTETIRFVQTQKASADEINTEKISKGFMTILQNIRKGIREKKPTTRTATAEALETIQATLAEKPRSEVTPDDLSDGVMAVLDSKITLKPGPRKVINGFVRWVMRSFGGSRKNSERKQFEAYREINGSLDIEEVKYHN